MRLNAQALAFAAILLGLPLGAWGNCPYALYQKIKETN